MYHQMIVIILNTTNNSFTIIAEILLDQDTELISHWSRLIQKKTGRRALLAFDGFFL